MRTCFVISPIGEDGSDTRKLADDLYELIIEPSLAGFGFNTVRADKIPRPSVITSDIIQLVQTSELCVIDLTGQNPNVFYECGRRHETGRPFIQLIKKGERLPFDLSGIRTIDYDLSTPRSTRDCIQKIQTYVKELESAGFEPTSSGESLSSIAQSLDRIERKLSAISAPGPLAGPSNAASQDPISAMMVDPLQILMKAMASGDIATASAQLPRVEQRLKRDELLTIAGLLASAGDERARDVLMRMLASGKEKLDVSEMKGLVGAIVQATLKLGHIEEMIEQMSPLIEDLASDGDTGPVDKAYFLNQLQKLLYGADRYQDALQIAERVLQLAPLEGAYHFNASLIFEKLGLLKKAEACVDRFLELEKEDPGPDHLGQAVEIFAAVGRKADARKLFEKLRTIDSGRANLSLLDPKVRAVVLQ